MQRLDSTSRPKNVSDSSAHINRLNELLDLTGRSTRNEVRRGVSFEEDALDRA